jgi:hypothetical protein
MDIGPHGAGRFKSAFGTTSGVAGLSGHSNFPHRPIADLTYSDDVGEGGTQLPEGEVADEIDEERAAPKIEDAF